MGIRSYLQQALASTVYYGSNVNRGITLVPSVVSATGGIIFDDSTNGYRTHIFTSPGSFIVSNGGNIEYLVVGGGGGGGAGALAAANGGGGGGGGFRTGTGLPVTATTYPITIGGGGAADTAGNPSTFDTITSAGGGYGGGTTASVGGAGGSGGGGRTVAGGPYAGGSGNTPPASPPQGNPGGSSNPASPFQAGGGGGAGEAGNTDGPGFGGDGSPITWIPVSYGTPGTAPGRYFSGGGGGGSDSANIVGGEGGGGSGGRGAPAISGSSGTTNTGGGGGGGASQPPAIPGLSGGSGIIAVRYPKTFDIVRDGLVLNLDAGDITSYPGSGSTWTDLSGNGYNFTINASAYSTSGGIAHMNFEGSFGAAKRLVGGVRNNVPNFTNGTVMVFTTILNSTANWRTLMRGTSSDHQVIIQSGANDLGMYDNSSNTFNDSTFDITSLPSPYTQFNCLTFRLSQSSPYYQFQYNADSTVYSITNANATFDNGFSIIGAYHNESDDVNNNSQYWGKIAVFLYYNRQLTSTEISQNYNALKGRFGL